MPWKPSDKSVLHGTILLSRADGTGSGIAREYVSPSYGHTASRKKINTLEVSFML
jgi:hypothetical protein